MTRSVPERSPLARLFGWLKGAVSSKSRPLARSGEIVTRAELATLDRASLERRALALCHTVWLGDGSVLCRVLGRFKMFVKADDAGFGAHLMLDGIWEGWLTTFMARRVRPGMAVVDVGANHGYYTLLFACLVGEAGRVAAIEPHPQVAALLRRSVAVNGFADRVRVVQQAAAEVDGRKVLLGSTASEPKNASLLPRGSEPGEGRFKVRLARVDTLLAEWPRVDFIKVDVEGAEEVAIAGMMEVLRRDRPQLVLEFNAGRCSSPSNLLEALEVIYGPPSVIELDGRLSRPERATLLDAERREDWMLYFAGAADNDGSSGRVHA